MRKLSLTLTVAVMVGLASSNVWAQPFTPTMGADTYGTAQGVGNLPVPTPKDNNDGSPDINDAINLLFFNTGVTGVLNTYTRNSAVDFLRWTLPDKKWRDLSTTDSDGRYVLIGLTAGNKNTLSVYDVLVPGVPIPVLPSSGAGYSGFGFVGNGLSGTPFRSYTSSLAPGTDFGWYLDTVDAAGPDYTWDSEPLNNAGKLDHMLTYHLAALGGKSLYIKTCTTTSDASCGAEFLYTFYDPYLIAWEDLPLSGGLLGDEDYDDMIFLVDRVQPVTPEPLSLVLLGSGLAGLAGIRRKRT